MIIELVTTTLNNVWKVFDLQRRVRFTVHRAFFISSGIECFFLNVTNISPKKEIEITHVWFDNKPQIPVLNKDRPLPKRLKPDETWETWIKVAKIPEWILESPYDKARLRISTGRIIKSKKNKNVPETGSVPGGNITGIQNY